MPGTEIGAAVQRDTFDRLDDVHTNLDGIARPVAGVGFGRSPDSRVVGITDLPGPSPLANDNTQWLQRWTSALKVAGTVTESAQDGEHHLFLTQQPFPTVEPLVVL